MRYKDWVGLGAGELRRHGPIPFTVDNLCARAGRTKGSFYHHFDGIRAFTLAVAHHWIDRETEVVARAALKGEGPMEKLRAMWQLTADTDHRLELAVRALALTDGEIAKLVASTDDRREAIMSGLLGEAYRLNETRARDFARMFHALHLSAQMRAPDDIAGFSRGSVRALVKALERESEAFKN